MKHSARKVEFANNVVTMYPKLYSVFCDIVPLILTRPDQSVGTRCGYTQWLCVAHWRSVCNHYFSAEESFKRLQMRYGANLPSRQYHDFKNSQLWGMLTELVKARHSAETTRAAMKKVYPVMDGDTMLSLIQSDLDCLALLDKFAEELQEWVPHGRMWLERIKRADNSA